MGYCCYDWVVENGTNRRTNKQEMNQNEQLRAIFKLQWDRGQMESKCQLVDNLQGIGFHCGSTAERLGFPNQNEAARQLLIDN